MAFAQDFRAARNAPLLTSRIGSSLALPAAAIMIAVFLSFVLGFDIRQIKLLGLGLAVAVLVDAAIVRMVLVPATMEILGDANWWLPRWLSRLIPKVKVEREAEEALTASITGRP